MDENEYLIFKCFSKFDKCQAGDILDADLIGKETNISMQDLYCIGESLERKSLVQLKNFAWNKIDGSPGAIKNFIFVLTKDGENLI